MVELNNLPLPPKFFKLQKIKFDFNLKINIRLKLDKILLVK